MKKVEISVYDFKNIIRRDDPPPEESVFNDSFISWIEEYDPGCRFSSFFLITFEPIISKISQLTPRQFYKTRSFNDMLVFSNKDLAVLAKLAWG